jgi:hypothetical protein
LFLVYGIVGNPLYGNNLLIIYTIFANYGWYRDEKFKIILLNDDKVIKEKIRSEVIRL